MSAIRVNPRYSITSATSNGTNLTYLANNAFVVGERIIVSGSSNSNFNTADSVVVSATSTQFSIAKSVSSSATSTGGIAYKVFSDWKIPTVVRVKVGGEWKTAVESWVKVDGVWRGSTFAGPPAKPTLSYVTTGVFQITNYDSRLVYSAIFKTGSGGTATLNTNTGRYTLSGEWSGFDVVARYAAGTRPSDPGYMERKKYAYSCRQVAREEAYDCNCQPCYLDADGYCTDVWGNCAPGDSPSWGQWGCPGPMCWVYYNGVVCPPCDTCYRTVYDTVCDVLINQSGYTNSGTEWYKVG